MKKTLLILTMSICCWFGVYAQATSLTIDCQTPGWLASYIGPNNVTTIRNLTVTGTINSTDITTIGTMVKSFNLHGRLDLGDVEIIEGELNGDMFGVTDCTLEYFALPKNISKLSGCLDWVSLDTLVAGSEMQPHFYYNINGGSETGYFSKGKDFNVKHLILREGSQYIGLNSNTYSGTQRNNKTLTSILFPESMKGLRYFFCFEKLKEMNIPSNVEILGEQYKTDYYLNSDTLFVPHSVKTFYDSWARNDGYNGSYYSYFQGRIKCVYLPEGLDTLWIIGLHYGANVTIHSRAHKPPKSENGGLKSPTIVYVPSGCKSIYENASGWANAIILEEIYAESMNIIAPLIMYRGDTYSISADFLPTNTTFKDVFWSTSDDSIMTISASGICDVKNCGEVAIQAINADRTCNDTKTIKVCEHTTGVSMTEESKTIQIGEKATLIANTIPLVTSDGLIQWSTSDEQIVTVDDKGHIKGINRGTCIITATSVDGGHKANCVVHVIQPVEAISLDKHSLSIKVGESESLHYNILPTNADNKKVLWSANDSTIATVDNNGTVTGKKSGNTVIKVVSEDNPEVSDSCVVKVTQPVTGITLDHTTGTIYGIGNKLLLTATVLPEDASNKDVNWTSSDQSVCFVSNGEVIGLSFGTSVIIATTVDGGFPATCVVNVKKARGDVNGDGRVNVSDVAELINMILGISSMNLENADIDSNGKVNVSDVAALINIILGIS